MGRRGLTEDYSLYFAPDEAAELILLAQLVPLKPPEAQADSVDRAAERMAAAAAGDLPRRAPITVRRLETGGWAIVDGNATYGVALREGWYALPARTDEPR
jgi:hypothetical protein